MDFNNPVDIGYWMQVLFVSLGIASGPAMVYFYISTKKFEASIKAGKKSEGEKPDLEDPQAKALGEGEKDA
jgi:hypothetical protein